MVVRSRVLGGGKDELHPCDQEQPARRVAVQVIDRLVQAIRPPLASDLVRISGQLIAAHGMGGTCQATLVESLAHQIVEVVAKT